MKKILLLCAIALFVACSEIKKNELYEITDYFVESLQTTYDSYGTLGGLEHKKITEDGKYQIMPVGRMINVKILEYVEDEVYENLVQDLKDHYKEDKRVRDVYINQKGTIMIDCRN